MNRSNKISDRINSIVISKGFWAKGGKMAFRTIHLKDLIDVFFPTRFEHKYSYLGASVWKEHREVYQALEPLVIFMDHKAKPWWCPRWVLRFLHLYGMDKSIVRVRNPWMANLLYRLTKGYAIIDWKTKWTDYDLRISIQGDEQMWWLAEAIERHFYNEGDRKEKEEIKKSHEKQI